MSFTFSLAYFIGLFIGCLCVDTLSLLRHPCLISRATRNWRRWWRYVFVSNLPTALVGAVLYPLLPWWMASLLMAIVSWPWWWWCRSRLWNEPAFTLFRSRLVWGIALEQCADSLDRHGIHEARVTLHGVGKEQLEIAGTPSAMRAIAEHLQKGQVAA